MHGMGTLPCSSSGCARGLAGAVLGGWWLYISQVAFCSRVWPFCYQQHCFSIGGLTAGAQAQLCASFTVCDGLLIGVCA
jgi:hypothetical protein